MKLHNVAAWMAALLCLASTAKAAISVGPGGSGTLTLDSPPAASEWATAVLPGGGTTYQDVTTLDAGVAGLNAATITTTLPTSGTVPPSTSSLGYRYNTAQDYIQSRPTTSGTNAANVLKATLQNDTGGTAFALTISYDFNITSPQAAGTDELPGWYAYYSVSGAPNTWIPIPSLSAVDAAGLLTATIDLSATPWAAGTAMYLLWADDNDEGQSDTGYNMDNVVFIASAEPPELDITLISPTNSESFVEGQIIPARAIGSGPITNVTFFLDGAFLSSFQTPPYSWDFTTAAGSHTIYAEAQDDTGARVYSDTNTFQVLPNQPPTIVITNAVDRSAPPISGDTFPVGASILFEADVQDDVGVISVDWYLDGNLFLTGNETEMTYNDALAGTHTISAVATDGSGLQAVSPDYTITVTNPPANFERVIENGEEWRYLATDLASMDPTTLQPPADGDDNMWYQPGFDDFGWPTGFAELGNGDTENGYPERTMIDVGPDGTRHQTIYFRKTFELNRDPSEFGAFAVKVLRDDGVVVWVNGTPVWTNNITVFDPVMGIVYTNRAVNAGDDGRDYQNFTLGTEYLVQGLNTIAVEVHQTSPTSSDLSFDLMLWGELPTLPVITLQTPTNGTTIPGGCAAATFTVTSVASTFVTNLIVYLDNVAVGSQGNVNGFNNQPVAIDVSGITPGLHTIYVQGRDLYDEVGYSQTNSVVALQNQAPVIAITNTFSTALVTNAPGQSYLVGTCFTNQLRVADDGSVTNVDWYVNGELLVRIPPANNWNVILFNNALALPGGNKLEAVAMDDCGVTVTSAPVFVVVTNPPAPTSVLVPNGSLWSYFNAGSAPAVQGAVEWFQAGYDASTWATGRGELGGGDANHNQDANNPEATMIDIGPSGDRYHAIYFRHEFTVANPAQYDHLTVRLLRDDGAVVYLNGAPVYTNNMQAGPFTYDVYAANVGADDGTQYHVADIPAGSLVAGANVLAVEVHQDLPTAGPPVTSSDLSFDLMLWAEGGTGPVAPQIGLVNNGNGTMTLSWPLGSFVPYSATALGTPRANWQPYTDQAPVVNNGRMELTVPTTGPARFFDVRTP